MKLINTTILINMILFIDSSPNIPIEKSPKSPKFKNGDV